MEIKQEKNRKKRTKRERGFYPEPKITTTQKKRRRNGQMFTYLQKHMNAKGNIKYEITLIN